MAPEESVVCVETSDPADGKFSGVVVAPETVETCFHCIRGHGSGPSSDRSILVHGKARDYTAQILRAEKSRDLCLLKVPGLDVSPAEIANDPPYVGQKVTAIGFPQGKLSANNGEVQHINSHGDPIIFSSAYIEGGFSGGGLFDASGRLAGVTAYDGNGSIPASWLRPLLERTDHELTALPDDAPKTEIDHYLHLNSGLNLDLAFSAAQRWARHYPDSFWANRTLGALAQNDMLKDCCLDDETDNLYRAARKAYDLFPSSDTLCILAKAENIAGRTQESVRLHWQRFEAYPTEREETLNDIIRMVHPDFGLCDLPLEERIPVLRRVADSARDEQLRSVQAFAYGAITLLHLKMDKADLALKSLDTALQLEPDAQKKLDLACTVLNTVVYSVRQPTLSFATECARRIVETVYSNPKHGNLAAQIARGLTFSSVRKVLGDAAAEEEIAHLCRNIESLATGNPASRSRK